jgi:hypothetical protein
LRLQSNRALSTSAAACTPRRQAAASTMLGAVGPVPYCRDLHT